MWRDLLPSAGKLAARGMTGRVGGAGLAMTNREGMSSTLLYLSYIAVIQVYTR
jgi:hypothetical protein